MSTQSPLGLVWIALALLAAAAVTHLCSLWSLLGNYTVPWFCGALALAVLLVAVTSALVGCPPGAVPISRVLAVWVGASVAVGAGMLIDGFSYQVPQDWASSLGEWIGFTLMLALMFWIPRSRGDANATSRDARDLEHQG